MTQFANALQRNITPFRFRHGGQLFAPRQLSRQGRIRGSKLLPRG
jgi:hypothetical protein